MSGGKENLGILEDERLLLSSFGRLLWRLKLRDIIPHSFDQTFIGQQTDEFQTIKVCWLAPYFVVYGHLSSSPDAFVSANPR